ncbi:MAG: SLBB domain-containing protein [Planctomycetota bacterium]
MGFIRMLAVLLLSLSGAGCFSSDLEGETDYEPEAIPTRRPNWVDELHEQVETVPPEQTPPGWRLDAPTSPGGTFPAGGTPQDFSNRIREGSLEGAVGTASANSNRGKTGGAGGGSTSRGRDGDVSQSVEIYVGDQESEPVVDTDPDPSPLERAYAGRLELEPDRELVQFGYSFFSEREPTDEDLYGPVDQGRLIQFGDELVINLQGPLAGNQVGQHTENVARDGAVPIAEAGSVPVAGLTLEQAEARIAELIETDGDRRRVRVQVAFGRLQPISVTVVGEVENPTVHEVPGRATVLHALLAAGGPRKSGSLRTIEILRDGGVVHVVDLYRVLIDGNLEGLSMLKPGDVVRVPPIGHTVGVAGAVQRPGIYELLDATDVAGALALAGGTMEFTFTPHARLERTVEGRVRQTFDLALNEEGLAEAIEGGELLSIGGIGASSGPYIVEIRGEVPRPGRYEFQEGMTVQDLIELAGGLLVEAYLPKAVISRQIGDAGSITIVPNREAVGSSKRTLVIDLEQALAGTEGHDLPLQPLDLLTVQSRNDAAAQPEVEVLGAVRRPGTYELTSGLTVSELVALAGNVVPEVYYDEAELIRRVYLPEERELGVERYRFDLGKALRHPKTEHDPILANHDQLIVRRLSSKRIRVMIEGEVPFPGPYVFPAGARITDLIAAAGGARDNADLRAAIFTRPSVEELQRSRFDIIRDESLVVFEQAFENLAYHGAPQEGIAGRLSLRNMREQMARMGQIQSVGRVVVDFTRGDYPESRHNLTLEDGDKLVIPARQETVAVLGFVFNSGAHVAEEGLTVQDLVARAGGIHEYGDEDRVYVIRADGTVQFVRQGHYELAGTAQLFPGDVVVVPKEPIERSLGHQATDLVTFARRAAEVAYIFSQLRIASPLSFTSVLQSEASNEVDVLGDDLVEK